MTAADDAIFTDRHFTSHDGLRLHMRVFGDASASWTPVVCLPGLSRSHRDFEELAVHLATHRNRPRRVVCMNYRGRSKSQWDENPDNYNLLVEMQDVYDGLAALDIPAAVVVGTSRGGLIGMMMAADRPAMMRGLVLVDIGPVIEPLGLARIKSYVGRIPPPGDWEDAARLLKQLHGKQFTAFDDDDWMHFARLSFRDQDGTPVSDYDPSLSETLAGLDFSEPLPDMWDLFRGLSNVSLMVVRGEHSDLLSADTVGTMRTIVPAMDVVEVPGQGHAPLLRGPHLMNRVSSFITTLEGADPPAGAAVPVR